MIHLYIGQLSKVPGGGERNSGLIFIFVSLLDYRCDDL